MCEASCGLKIEVRDGAVVSIRGDREDPFSHGHVCPKGVALQDIQTDPDRLRRPVRRTPGGEWEEIPWAEALDRAAAGLAAVRRQHGRDAVAVYLGNPNAHNYGTLLFVPQLLRVLGTRNRYSATSVDQLPHHVAAHLMFGHQLLLPVPDLDRTRYLLILGANPAASNGSLATAPGFARRLRAIERRGGTVVVVDPRRTETARLASRHLFIRPGGDALLLAAVLRTILEEDLAAPGRLEAFCTPWEPVRQAVAPFAPQRVAPATGIAAEEIRRLAEELAAAPAAAVYGRFGVSTVAFGGLCHWLINLLNIATGNLDRPGGSMFNRPVVDPLRGGGRGGLGRRHTRVRGLPGFGRELPVAALAEEILTTGEGQVRALLTVAGNPVLTTPDGRRLDRALESLDFMVSVDLYLNETTRHADLVLPPTAPLERDHYDLALNLLAVRRVARYSPPVLTPQPDILDDWQILAGLTRRLDDGPPGERLKRRLAAALGPRRLLDLALRSGPDGAGFLPGRGGLSLRRLERHPHGIDLGPLEPCLPDRLRTPDRRIALAPEPFLEDVARLEEALGGGELRPEEGAFLLIGRRDLRSNNSWMHNLPRLLRGPDRCTLLVHPDDAARLGIDDGQRVTLRGPGGSIVVPARISDGVLPGVLSLPHGWGHDRPGARLGVARGHAGASFNDLLDGRAVDPLCGTAVLNGLPVTIEPLAHSTSPESAERARGSGEGG
ncbi:MAG TPA: molybdopterin oxidoreductase family protein [Acidobacteria bacterium]|nr:molybdopterin oxidoreductase family protein [Acidobacteriota bacterium]